MNASFASKCLLLPLLVLAELQVVDLRTAPKFAGKSIPDPPRQKEPWTPPPTKLPRFLVSATAALFEQGMADPRGCEYREVEIGDGTIVKTRGFVLPERAGEAGRFVVSWDGVVYPAFSVGALADLDKDVRTLAESMKREAARSTTTARVHRRIPARRDPDRGRTVGRRRPVGAEALPPVAARPCRPGRSPLRRRDGLDSRHAGPEPDRLSHQLSHPRDGLGRRGLPAGSCPPTCGATTRSRSMPPDGSRRSRRRSTRRPRRWASSGSRTATSKSLPRTCRSSASFPSCWPIRNDARRSPRGGRSPSEGATPRRGSPP